MSRILRNDVERFVRAVATSQDGVLAEMDDYARVQGFPHVGHDVGATLRLLARLVDADRAFEFGSGFGYSAYWIAAALPADGEIVLTEHDREELEMAREFMDRGGFDSLARYEHGDAIDTAKASEGPFDLVLVDIQKDRYLEAFETIRDKISTGGVIVADNAMTSGSVDFDELLAYVEGDQPDDMNESTAGIAEYLTAVRDDLAFETVVWPLGEGLAVSYRQSDIDITRE
ncbi:MAG: caffeoyl-CoA O-methyltransferase [Halobacteriales archaeon]|jgi:caffeoyl-CoA O-methyltransferase